MFLSFLNEAQTDGGSTCTITKYLNEVIMYGAKKILEE
jgi:hypothetical protein